jgi:F-type H+-transporting ATPase subunit epsilon
VDGERTIRVEVVTPEGVVFAADVAMAVLPGVEGELGILPRHQPLVTLLAVGETRIQGADDKWHYLATGIGYAQVLFDKLLVVVDHGELSEDIDVERASSAAERARERLAAPDSGEAHDRLRAAQSILRAENRLRVAKRTQ